MSRSWRAGARRGRRPVLRALLAVILLLVLALVIAGAVFIPRLTAEPDWWTPELSADAHAAELAEEAEKGMTRVLSREREPDQTWTVELTEDQANAWLATRLRRWAESQHAAWPEALRGVRIDFEPGALTIGLAAEVGSAMRFASLTLTPERAGDGPIMIRATGARIGVQPVPLSLIHTVLGDRIPEDAMPRGVARAIREGAAELPERYALDADRAVRIESVSIEAGRLLVTCSASPD